ncbi:hypothetical protein BASA81_016446 [Batrachochytrium salamandrivorans]|nr:hypothetical protein BASA81_016446 [Batrachochytrium salamandrivorans]
MSTKKLTRRQARWSLELSEYDSPLPIGLENLMDGRMPLSRQSDHHLENDCSNFKRILDPKQIIDLQSLISDMDLHVIVHSEVPAKSLCLGIRLAFDNCRFLAGEDNVWMDDIPEVTLEKCKQGAEETFVFGTTLFFEFLEDGKSTATYVHYEQRSKDYSALPRIFGSSKVWVDNWFNNSSFFGGRNHEEGLEGLHCTMSTVPA